MQRAFLWALISIVAIAPLPLGSNRPLGWSLLSLGIGILLVVWSAHQIWSGRTLAVSVQRVRVPLILFTVACGWVLIQLVPNIPFGLAHPGWQEINTFFSTDVPGRITIDPGWTTTVLMRWLAYASIFWLTLQLCRERAAADLALKAFVFAGVVYALYGIVAFLGVGDTILVYEKWTGRGSLTSTFVNRNTYATYAGFGFIASLALAASFGGRGATKTIPSLGERLRNFLARSIAKNIYTSLAVFIIATALLLTGSRAGVLCAAAGLIVFLGQFYRSALWRGGLITVQSVTFLIVITTVVFLSGGLIGERFSRGSNGERVELYKQTITAIEDHALYGSGLGSFPQIYQLYRGNDLQERYIEKAHNSYLENSLELGIPAATCLFLSVFWLTVICWRGRTERSREHHFAAMGVAVSVLVGLHSLADFSLQVPGVTVSYMFLMGIAVAQSFSSRRR